MYTDDDYKKAILFALNYKRDLPMAYHYNEDQDIFKVNLMDEGWYSVSLKGFFVRSCLKWRGIKQWTK